MARITCMVPGLVVLLAAGALGCPSTYEPDDDSAADDDAGDDDAAGNPPSISSLEPSTGAPTGGYTVNVYGANFTTAEDTDIYFGTALAQMVGCGPAMCTVQAPAADEGTVDVSMANSQGEDTLVGGFTYQQDLSNTVSYYAVLTRLQYAYPDAYNPPAVSEAFASATFFEPEPLDVMRDVLWGGVLPGLGTCAAYDRVNGWETPSVWALGAGISVDLVGPTTYTLEKDWSNYVLSGLPVDDYLPGTYMLDIAGGSDLQPEQVTNALTAPPAFTMMPSYVGEYLSLAEFQAGLDVTLSESCDYATLNVDIYDTTAAYVESVVCYASSTDHLTMDSSLLTSYFSAAIVAVRADCYAVNTNPVYSGSRMVGVGRAMLSGVIYIQ